MPSSSTSSAARARLSAGSPQDAIALLKRARRFRICSWPPVARDTVWGRTLTHSPKVFLPITNLCRDRCACTFRKDRTTPRRDHDARRRAPGRARCPAGMHRDSCARAKPELAFRSHLSCWPSSGTGRPSALPRLRIALDAIAPAHQRRRIDPRGDAAAVTAQRQQGSCWRTFRAAGRGAASPAPDKEPRLRLAMLDQAGARSSIHHRTVARHRQRPLAGASHAARSASCTGGTGTSRK